MTNSLTNRKQEKFTVGEGEQARTFISNSWSPLKCAKKLPTVGKCFATPISMLFSAGGEEDLKEAVPQALYMLFEQMEENDIAILFADILSDVWAENGTELLDIDTHLHTIDEMLVLVSSVLKQHYGCLIEGKGFKSLFQMIIPLNQASTL